ncbi:hypothetical protein K469DRAFT_491159, partial [Zopfia rhizophila CBS 207.26]
IDAICVNEEGDGEKERQVYDMDGVYRRAKYILLWLGPEENGSQLAMGISADSLNYFL